MKTNYIISLIAIIFIFIGCESLEDTYDEFLGDGKIHYVGQCTNIEIQPGWYRLKVKWEGNLDASIKTVKVSWQAENETTPHVRFIKALDASVNKNLKDSIYIENLTNSVYTVTVTNLTADSTESLAVPQYARPYTEEHEDLRTFSRGIINFYTVKDKLIVMLDEDNENLEEMVLSFWDKNGTKHTWDIKEHMNVEIGDWFYGYREYMFLLPEEKNINIDFEKPLLIDRKGYLNDCIDEITFTTDTLLLTERVWSANFNQWLRKNFGESYNESDIQSVKTIELDYNMSTLQDLFYFPNLRKVVLGKNRYVVEGYETENASTTDAYKALTTFKFFKEIYGEEFTIECYNQQYCLQSFLDRMLRFDAIDENIILKKGINDQIPPVIKPLDTSDWEATCSDTLFNGHKEKGVAYLLDNNPETYFEPNQTASTTVYEIEFDMKKLQRVHGIKVVQPAVITQTSIEYLISSMKIEVSSNGYDWENATYEDSGILIGNSPGETTYINIPEELQKDIRYIRLTVANKQVEVTSEGMPLFRLRLGDFIPY